MYLSSPEYIAKFKGVCYLGSECRWGMLRNFEHMEAIAREVRGGADTIPRERQGNDPVAGAQPTQPPAEVRESGFREN